MNLESLLISRDATLQEVLHSTLEKMSVNVEVCEGTENCCKLLGNHKFDAVIVDCDDLEGGLEILNGLRKTHSNSSSVVFAVLNGKTTTQEAFKVGANFVLQKPLTPLHAARCFNTAMSFMMRERRRYFRHPVEIQVRMELAQGSEVSATTTNLSEGGMAIHVLDKLPREAVVKLQFTLPGSSTLLELKGVIAWADEMGRAGVRFVEVPQSTQYQLDEFLTDRLAAEVPPNLQGYLALH